MLITNLKLKRLHPNQHLNNYQKGKNKVKKMEILMIMRKLHLRQASKLWIKQI
jgi:hypothetical protein